MTETITVNIPAITVIDVLRRELGEARILFLLAGGHTPDAREAQILFDAGRKLLELEKVKNVEKARVRKIGDFDSIPDK